MRELNIELYKKLFLVRQSEDYIIEYYPSDDMKTPMHMSYGEEAISVGVCHALTNEDQILATYRSHAAYIAKTLDTDSFFAELYGKVTGCCAGKGGSMHLSAPEHGFIGTSAIVASHIPVATGLAFANKMHKNNKIACVFFGDGAVDEGVFWESVNVASLKQLPVMFINENNSFAVHTPVDERRGYKSITEIVGKFDCNVFEDDTTDVEQIYHLVVKAIEAIRTTGKPAFLHLKCYRYLEHVGISKDFNAGYRSEDEFNEWLKRDPVALQRAKLIKNGYCSEDEVKQLESVIKERILESIKKAQAAPFPQNGDIYKGVFYEKN